MLKFITFLQILISSTIYISFKITRRKGIFMQSYTSSADLTKNISRLVNPVMAEALRRITQPRLRFKSQIYITTKKATNKDKFSSGMQCIKTQWDMYTCCQKIKFTRKKGLRLPLKRNRTSIKFEFTKMFWI